MTVCFRRSRNELMWGWSKCRRSQLRTIERTTASNLVKQTMAYTSLNTPQSMPTFQLLCSNSHPKSPLLICRIKTSSPSTGYSMTVTSTKSEPNSPKRSSSPKTCHSKNTKSTRTSSKDSKNIFPYRNTPHKQASTRCSTRLWTHISQTMSSRSRRGKT